VDRIEDSAADLARDYLRHWAADFPIDGDWSAWEAVEYLLQHDPHKAWTIIQELVRQVPDDEQLHGIADGPLAILLVQHGPDIIGQLEREYASNARFRTCLSGFSGAGVSDRVWLRLEALVQRTADGQ
jgi:hypothetical protein